LRRHARRRSASPLRQTGEPSESLRDLVRTSLGPWCRGRPRATRAMHDRLSNIWTVSNRGLPHGSREKEF
jgi:hypothetical protein